jgi:hypothetical protein
VFDPPASPAHDLQKPTNTRDLPHTALRDRDTHHSTHCRAPPQKTRNPIAIPRTQPTSMRDRDTQHSETETLVVPCRTILRETVHTRDLT